jgi:inner membrane transporter RhtA
MCLRDTPRSDGPALSRRGDLPTDTWPGNAKTVKVPDFVRSEVSVNDDYRDAQAPLSGWNLTNCTGYALYVQVVGRLLLRCRQHEDLLCCDAQADSTYPTRVKRILAPVATILVAMVSIQSGAALAKQLFPVVGAAGASALRLVFAAAILLLVWKPFGGNRMDSVGPAVRRAVVLYGVSLGTMNLLFYFALERIPLGLAVAFEFCGPLGIALIRSRRTVDVLWVVCAVSGLAILVPKGNSARLDPVGVAFALGAGVCWALYIVFGQAAGAAMHGGMAVALGMSIAAVMVLPVGVIAAGRNLLSWEAARTAIAIAILSSALPYSLEMYALKRMPAQVFGVLMSIEPAIGALSGLVFLSERLSSLQWVGIGLIMMASTGSVLGRITEPAPELL